MRGEEWAEGLGREMYGSGEGRVVVAGMGSVTGSCGETGSRCWQWDWQDLEGEIFCPLRDSDWCKFLGSPQMRAGDNVTIR
jgi:hypothetical protein